MPKRVLTFCIVLLGFVSAQTPEDVFGVWQGSIEIPGRPLEVVVTFESEGEALTGTLGIPAQGAADLPLKDVTLGGDALSFVIGGVDGDPTFDGTLMGGSFTGTFSQSGQSFPVTLTQGESADTTATEPMTAENYQDPEGRFSVPVPTNWTVQENKGYTTLLSPEGDIHVHLLTLSKTNLEQLLLPVAPAGAHWSTAHDMARYLITELNVGVAPNGVRVVSEKNLRTTWEPQVEVSADTSYGLGWFIRDYKGLELTQHGGNTFGFTSDFAFLPGADLGIVVLTNAQGTNAFNSAVRERLFELVFEQEPEADKQATFSFSEIAKELEKVSNNLRPLDMTVVTPYLGSYQNDALGEVDLRLDGDSVVFSSGEFAAPLVAEAEGDVRYLLNGPPIAGAELKLTGKGDAPSLTIGEGAVKYVFKRLE